MRRKRELRSTGPSSSPERRALALLLVVVALFVALPAFAESRTAVIEIDPAAEAILDARAVRRQVTLELSEIDVPSFGAPAPPLFVRVLGRDDHQVEVELWARGELSDRRLVSGAESGQHLLVRRVGLAAAELARRLRQKRLVAERLRQRRLAELRTLAQRNARRTLEGPLALRSEALGNYGRDVWMLGSAVTAEVTLRRSFRLDFGARFLAAFDPDSSARLAWFELTAGPAYRLHPSARVDVDLAALATVASVHASGVRRVDSIDGQRDTWSARAGLAVRIQPRLLRWARLSFGAESGLLLRPVPIEFSDARREQVSGLYVGGALGVVLTPR